MLIIPAIDLKDGKCVRLRRGIMDDSTVFSDHPVEMAEQWVSQGAKRIHLVDLNGAFEGRPVNADAISEIVRKFSHIPVQIGGGIRSMSIAKTYIDVGISYLIIGTMAIDNPEFVTELCKEFPGKIIVGLDAIMRSLQQKDGLSKLTFMLRKLQRSLSKMVFLRLFILILQKME